MKRRVPIPKSIEREVLFRNQSVCCVCQKSGIQIHHIDSDPSNNKLDNLCVLCVDHHAQASSKGTMTKGFDLGLLRKYKAEWEGVVLRRYQQVSKASQASVKRSDEQLLYFEIRRTGLSLPGTKSKSAFNQSVDYLYNWCLIEADRIDVVEVISDIHWFMEEWQVEIIAARLYEFFWHFIGPDKVPMNTKDQKEIVSAIELLGYLATQAALFTYLPNVVARIIESLSSFYEMGKSYKRSKLISRVQKSLKKIRDEIADELRDSTNKKTARDNLKKSLALIDKAIVTLK